MNTWLSKGNYSSVRLKGEVEKVTPRFQVGGQNGGEAGKNNKQLKTLILSKFMLELHVSHPHAAVGCLLTKRLIMLRQLITV